MKVLTTIFFLMGICGSLRADLYSVEPISLPPLLYILHRDRTDHGHLPAPAILIIPQRSYL